MKLGVFSTIDTLSNILNKYHIKNEKIKNSIEIYFHDDFEITPQQFMKFFQKISLKYENDPYELNNIDIKSYLRDYILTFKINKTDINKKRKI